MAEINKKIDKLEERLRGTETAIATLASNTTLNTENLKENIAKTHQDLVKSIDSIKDDMKEDSAAVNTSINALNKSLQTLYVSQSGSDIAVKSNEKIVWGVVTVIFTIGLYVIQGFIKSGGVS